MLFKQDIEKVFAEEVKYKNWKFYVGGDSDLWLQIQFEAPDNFTGKVSLQKCRKWKLSKYMTKTELVRTAFLAVAQAERHEMEEGFTYKGQAIFNSHISADKLVDLCVANGEAVYQYRNEA